MAKAPHRPPPMAKVVIGFIFEGFDTIQEKMIMRRYTQIALAGVALTALFFGVLQAGPLDPPPGAVQPTNRVQLNAQSITLPYTISQPGSYVLTSNLTGVAGQDGIIISANDVTLDLNGFSLIGVPGSSAGVSASGSGIAVINGTIRGWSGNGINGWSAHNARLKSLSIMSCAIGAIVGEGSSVSHCVFRSNQSHGLLARNASSIHASTATLNGNNGFDLDLGSVLTNSTAQQNAGYGIRANGDNVVMNCTSRDNTLDGIRADDSIIMNSSFRTNGDDGVDVDGRSIVRNCVSAGNSGAGIEASGSARIESNSIMFNVGFGVDGVNFGGLVVKNYARGNSAGNYDPGLGGIVGPMSGSISTHPWANFEN